MAVVLVDIEADEDKVEGAEEEDEPTDNSPWANSDRDYTYEEVSPLHTHTCKHTLTQYITPPPPPPPPPLTSKA